MRSIIFLTLVVFGLCQTDYYTTLEVSSDCSQNEVDKAYKRLSDKYNPSSNPGNREIARKYEAVQRAHEILSDSYLRQILKRHGEGMMKLMERYRKTGRSNEEQRSYDLFYNINFTLEELYSGLTHSMDYTKDVMCPQCGGKGGTLGKCSKCNGRGVIMKNVQMGPMTVQTQTYCDKCGGRGTWIEVKCNNCHGQKLVKSKKVLQTKIEKGMKAGDEIILSKEASQQPDMAAGDVIIHIQEHPHRLFARIGNNLYMDITISLEEALLGFKRAIKCLDGETITIERNEVTQPFQSIVVPKKGMPIRGTSQFGDLHVRVEVMFPKVTAEEGKALANILNS